MNHPWNLSRAEAAALQKQLSAKVVNRDRGLEDVQYVAGVDVAYDEPNNRQIAAVAVLEATSLDRVAYAVARERVKFPYVPGLFSFREIPTLAKALVKLKSAPDLVVCDGQGVAHPRRFGLACHLGLMFDIPTIGCAKTNLIGEADAPGPDRGDGAPLIHQGTVIGRVLRTRKKTKPVYVSVGHLISLQTACDWILRLTPDYRIPETTRQADQLVRRMKRGDRIL